jgi:4-hydroxybenzoate polyprenyltransferase
MLSFFLHSNLWLASCAMSLALFVGFKSHHELSMVSSLWVLFFVLGFYSVHGVLSLKKNQINDIALRRYYKSKACRWVTVLGVSGAVLLIVVAAPALWIPLFIFTFGSLFYDLPIWKHRNKTVIPSVREWPNVKALVVATAISLIVFLIPSVWEGWDARHFDARLWAVLWFHLLINTVIGDLRDLRLDTNKKLKTLPTWLGFQRTRWLLISLSLMAAIFVWQWEMGWELTLLFLGDGILLYCWINEGSKPKRYHVVDVAHWIPLVTFLSLHFLNPLLKSS